MPAFTLSELVSTIAPFYSQPPKGFRANFQSWLQWAAPLVAAATAGRRPDHAWLERNFFEAASAVDLERRRGPNGVGGGLIPMGRFADGDLRIHRPKAPVPVSHEASRARPFAVGTVDNPIVMTGPESGNGGGDYESYAPPSSRRARATPPNRKRA